MALDGVKGEGIGRNLDKESDGYMELDGHKVTWKREIKGAPWKT